MKHKGKDFYCPNSGICICAITGRKRPKSECVQTAKKKGEKK